MNADRPRFALVSGADHHGLAAQLRSDGYAVVEQLGDLPSGSTLDTLVLDLTAQAPRVSFRTVTDEHFRILLDTQLYALVAMTQAALPHMDRGSTIVAIVPNAHLGSWDGVHVAASAAACVAMIRSMALELPSRAIRANCVATGREGAQDDASTGRSQIAKTVAFLAGGDSSPITGETLLADRGASLRMMQARRLTD